MVYAPPRHAGRCARGRRPCRRARRFDRLGLAETYLDTLEPTPAAAKPRAHQYLGTLDATEWNPSFDLHGAGGHVSTLDDRSRFYRALVGGRVLKRPATLRMMLDERMSIDAGPIGRETCFGQAGLWGVAVYHCPHSRVTIATMINQADGFIPPTVKLLTAAHRIAAE
jgi:D-alanyl-D-alanine carboxypeptidase